MNAKILYPTIDEQQFGKLFAEKSRSPYLVVFTADWAGEGILMDAIIKQLAETHQEKIGFFRIDVEASKNITRQLGIRHLPTIFFFQNGEIVDRTTGMKSRRQLQECIEKML